MEFKAVIARLNELYHHAQQGELTGAELEERERLRRVYLNTIRQQVEATLAGTKPGPDGHVHSPGCGCEHKLN